MLSKPNELSGICSARFRLIRILNTSNYRVIKNDHIVGSTPEVKHTQG